LDVGAVEADVMVGDGSTGGVVTEGEDGVGVEVEGVAAAVFEQAGAEGHEGTVGKVVVVTVVACQGDGGGGVDYLNVAEALSEGGGTVEVDGVGDERSPAADDEGTVKEMPSIVFRVVLTAIGEDGDRVGEDTGGAEDGGDFRRGVVTEGVGEQGEIGGIKADIVAKDGRFGGEVVVEGIGVDGDVVIDEAHLFTQAREAHSSVVMQITAIEMDTVTLLEMDETKGFEVITGLVETGAVAIHPCTTLPKGDIAIEDLCIGVQCPVEDKGVSPFKVNLVAGYLGSSRRIFLCQNGFCQNGRLPSGTVRNGTARQWPKQ
jgi:hypothetical protein